MVKEGLLDILKGNFLVSEEASKNWRFLLFASVLAALMIASSHQADKKVHEIAELTEQVKTLKSTQVKQKREIQQLLLESRLKTELAPFGLGTPEQPPAKIQIVSQP
jgi:type II secretory pathway component PulL